MVYGVICVNFVVFGGSARDMLVAERGYVTEQSRTRASQQVSSSWSQSDVASTAQYSNGHDRQTPDAVKLTSPAAQRFANVDEFVQHLKFCNAK